MRYQNNQVQKNSRQSNAMFIEFPERMHALIPIDSINVKNKQILTRSQPFEMFYTLNCQNLCSDFHEDLEFKFSWGITAMIQRFTGKAKGKSKALLYNANVSISVSFGFPRKDANVQC